MLVRFLSCRERFRLRYVCGLEPPDRWHHTFGYGNMWHACEEAHARNEDWTLSLDHHVAQLEQRYPLQREELSKWHNVAHVQFPEYVKHWADHPDVLNRTPLMQEQVFDVPYHLHSGRVVRLRGKWDCVDLIDGGIYLQENKTKGDIDKIKVERQLKFDLQTMLYLVALKETVKYHGGSWVPEPLQKEGEEWPICGVRYNVVRRPLSGGKGNISPHKAKSTKTKYTPAESGADFYERLRRDYIAAEPEYWFFRVRCEISTHDIEVFRRTCLDPLLECLCDWYGWMAHKEPPLGRSMGLHYRTPFGVWSALEEGGSTEYDNCLATGSEVGLRRVQELFTELQ